MADDKRIPELETKNFYYSQHAKHHDFPSDWNRFPIPEHLIQKRQCRMDAVQTVGYQETATSHHKEKTYISISLICVSLVPIMR